MLFSFIHFKLSFLPLISFLNQGVIIEIELLSWSHLLTVFTAALAMQLFCRDPLAYYSLLVCVIVIYYKYCCLSLLAKWHLIIYQTQDTSTILINNSYHQLLLIEKMVRLGLTSPKVEYGPVCEPLFPDNSPHLVCRSFVGNICSTSVSSHLSQSLYIPSVPWVTSVVAFHNFDAVLSGIFCSTIHWSFSLASNLMTTGLCLVRVSICRRRPAERGIHTLAMSTIYAVRVSVLVTIHH